jgi:flagellar basal-body rod protein FlgB
MVNPRDTIRGLIRQPLPLPGNPRQALAGCLAVPSSAPCRTRKNRRHPPGIENWHGGCLSPGSAMVRRRFGPMAAESLFGVHGAALEVRGQRMGVLASNIANASTPGFKAKDIDFKSALASMEQDGNGSLDAATKYRVPLQTSMDGNTVELNEEQTAFAENAVQYQTTLSFLNGRIGQITRALKGE